MIEYLATAGAVGFAWATIAWREKRRPAVGGLALAAGLVGMLVKPTTAVFWILPALAYRPNGLGRATGGALMAAALVLVPLGAAVLWTRHADAIKAASPTTAWLTSDALRDWNFGTLGQRFASDTWEVILDRLEGSSSATRGSRFSSSQRSPLVRSRQRRFWLGIVLAAVLPPLVFTNLYYQHDYYLAAVSPAIAALIGLGVGFAWRLLPHAPGPGLAIVAGVLLASSTLVLGRDYVRLIYVDEPDAQTLALAHEVGRADTGGRSHRGRRARLVSGGPLLRQSLGAHGRRAKRRRRRTTPHARGRLSVSPRRGAERRRYQPPRALALAERARHAHLWDRGLRCRAPGVAFLATDDASEMPTGAVLRRGLRIACGQPARIPGGERGTLILHTRPVAEHAGQRVGRARTASCEESHVRGIRAHERRNADDQVLRSGVAHSSTCATLRVHSAPSGRSPRRAHDTVLAMPSAERSSRCFQPSRSSARAVRSRTPLIAELRVLDADLPGRARLAERVRAPRRRAR